MIEKERDNLERSISTILKEPFMRRGEDQPITVRIQKLKEQLLDAEKKAKASQEERARLKEEIAQKKEENMRQAYEFDKLEIDLKAAKE